MDKRPGFRKRIALELFRSIRRNRAKLHELRTLFWAVSYTHLIRGCVTCKVSDTA